MQRLNVPLVSLKLNKIKIKKSMKKETFTCFHRRSDEKFVYFNFLNFLNFFKKFIFKFTFFLFSF